MANDSYVWMGGRKVTAEFAASIRTLADAERESISVGWPGPRHCARPAIKWHEFDGEKYIEHVRDLIQ